MSILWKDHFNDFNGIIRSEVLFKNTDLKTSIKFREKYWYWCLIFKKNWRLVSCNFTGKKPPARVFSSKFCWILMNVRLNFNFSHHIYFVHHHWQSSWYKTKGKPLIISFSCCPLFYLKQILNLKVWRCAIKPVKPGVNWRFKNVLLWHLIKCYMQTFRLVLHVAFPFTLTTYFANCFTSIQSWSENFIL